MPTFGLKEKELTKSMKGQQVNIYQDPITRLDFEGVATIERVDSYQDEDPQYMGIVSFEKGDGGYFRTFGEQDLLPS